MRFLIYGNTIQSTSILEFLKIPLVPFNFRCFYTSEQNFGSSWLHSYTVSGMYFFLQLWLLQVGQDVYYFGKTIQLMAEQECLRNDKNSTKI